MKLLGRPFPALDAAVFMGLDQEVADAAVAPGQDALDIG